MAWVRSQDKSSLLNVDIVWVKSRELYGSVNNTQRDFYHPKWEIGTFPTEEAAIAELDRIERWIESDLKPTVFQISKGE